MSVNSIRNLLEIAYEKNPNKTALVDKDGSLTYEELFAKVNQVALYLDQLNLPFGSRVGIYGHKDIAKVISILGVLSTSYVFVPITRLLKAEQVQHIIDDCNVSCMITDAAKLELIQKIGFEGKVICTQSVDDPNIVSFDEIYKCFSHEYTCSIKGHNNAAITYSFSTGGLPKGVVISHRNFMDGARVVSKYLHLQDNDVISGLLSFSVDYGLNQIFCSLYKQATFAIYTFLTPGDFFMYLIKQKVTVLPLMPIHLSQMFDEDVHRLPDPVQLQDIRIITSSGGNVTPKMMNKTDEYFSKAQFYYMHGLSEAFRSAYLNPTQLKIRPTSIGKAIPDVDLYVINEQGKECAPREVGELIHRGAGIYKGYWNSKVETNTRFKSIQILKNVVDLGSDLIDEIVVASGDYVYKDEEGYIYFVGRHDDMIKSGGYRINPLEIETVVYNNISSIEKCAVFGIDNEDIEEEIVLVYQANKQLAKNELLLELKQHLPIYMVPSRIIFKQQLPMMVQDHDKINKKSLKDEVINLESL
ncbi:MAG: AMP-binding protein [Campylobacterota bacterium]|nr:AMP-binding protein [Campylobacterota bacterium]